MKKFQKYHLLTIFDLYEEEKMPLDLLLNKYFRAHKAIGSNDRKVICENLYAIIRWRGLVDAKLEGPITWERRLEEGNIDDDTSLPLHTRVSFPKFLFEKLVEGLGEKNATKFCLESNQEAPITIRANALKTTRDALFAGWKDRYPVRKCKHSPYGITFDKRINFFTLPEFKKGLFEVQDEGSQLVALHVKAKPGDHILDYCAGSGGKSLAIAPLMEKKGVIYLHDIRPHALVQAKKRLKRAGVQNGQIWNPKHARKKVDWLLLDVPCSGMGTLRRNPDMKWKIDRDTIDRLVAVQKEIFEEALPFLAPDGHIVYATCSVLPEENELQIARFCEKYDLEEVEPQFKSSPLSGGMDGFFAATLRRKKGV
ncbi:MAG: RsmB/NOP family class I SAM-dependent RNA methyltransferase [Simkaniaceae bacterium]|nr:RsmB/NOP family class I SAM-dependent RNA methyltransferase [Simkaniaceae bacterium]